MVTYFTTHRFVPDLLCDGIALTASKIVRNAKTENRAYNEEKADVVVIKRAYGCG